MRLAGVIVGMAVYQGHLDVAAAVAESAQAVEPTR